MTSRDDEFGTDDDLAGFDFLITHLEETGRDSMNLRDFVFTGLNDADKARDAAKEANKGRDDLKERARETAILSRVLEVINPADITLGQLDRDVSLEQLIEIRQSLEP